MNDRTQVPERDQKAVARRQGDQPARQMTLTPAVGVFEDSQGITLRVDLPGVTKDKLDVKVHDGNLYIEAEAVVPTPAGLRLQHAEIREPHFARAFSLSPDFDTSKIAMEDFFHDPFATRGPLDRWFGDFSSSRFQPPIDVVDEGKILRVTVELPGMEREDLTVSVEDGAYGAFMRTIPMPENADPDHALAKFDRGVLTLTVPKKEPPRSASRTIDIG